MRNNHNHPAVIAIQPAEAAQNIFLDLTFFVGFIFSFTSFYHKREDVSKTFMHWVVYILIFFEFVVWFSSILLRLYREDFENLVRPITGLILKFSVRFTIECVSFIVVAVIVQQVQYDWAVLVSLVFIGLQGWSLGRLLCCNFTILSTRAAADCLIALGWKYKNPLVGVTGCLVNLVPTIKAGVEEYRRLVAAKNENHEGDEQQ